jgi:threonine/homoserine/homoserine lactone efflux protein
MTSHSLFLAFLTFAAVMAFTPGPNNIMLLASGLNYGFRRTLPHVAGVTFGFAFMVGVTGLGLGAVFTTYPVLQTVLKYAGVAYLIYLAVAIATSGPVDAGEAQRRRPMTFIGAALFQWINIKGWVMAIGTITAYAAIARYPWNVAAQASVSLVLGFGSAVTWALCGSALQSLVKSPRAVRAFNLVMAALLLASLYPVLHEP